MKRSEKLLEIPIEKLPKQWRKEDWEDLYTTLQALMQRVAERKYEYEGN